MRSSSRNRNAKYPGTSLGLYYLHVRSQRSRSFPMRSKGPSVTKRPLTSAASDVKAEYCAIFVCVCGSEDGITTRAHAHVRTFTRVEAEPLVLDPALHRLQLAFTTYVLRVSDPALYVYVIRRLCPRNFIRACRLRSRNFHVKVSRREEEGGGGWMSTWERR